MYENTPNFTLKLLNCCKKFSTKNNSFIKKYKIKVLRYKMIN